MTIVENEATKQKNSDHLANTLDFPIAGGDCQRRSISNARPKSRLSW